MQNVHTLETPALMDLLARYNADYSRLMLAGTKDEFEECRLSINLIRDELSSRKQTEEYSSPEAV